jgi:multidrug resistance efflux pump
MGFDVPGDCDLANHPDVGLCRFEARRSGIRRNSQADAQKVASEFDQAKAELEAAQWRLGQTTVRAPFDGYVTSVLLRPGARVTADSDPVMSFVEESWQEVVVQINQINLRNVAVGQPAEIIFKLYPGQVFAGKVQKIMNSGSSGTLAPSGLAPESFEIHAEPFWVVIEMDDESIDLPPGAVGSVAIYTGPGPSVFFRKLSLRMENWLNFVFP